MRLAPLIAATSLLGAFPFASAAAQQGAGEEEFEQMAATLKANDSERRSAIATCIELGIGDDPTGLAEFMGVPVEKAARAWCFRMTTGIANGKLHLVDINGLHEGMVTPASRSVLTTVSEGE
jgi:hypothetical protein